MSKLALHVKDFRAIANAEIELDGITVISGINSAGKSTLSKLLYYVVKLTLQYEKIITDSLIQEVGKVLRSLSMLLNELHSETDKSQAGKRNRTHIVWQYNAESTDIESLPGLFSSLLGDMEKSFLQREEQKPFSKQELTRMSNALDTNVFGRTKSPTASKNIPELFDYIRINTNELFDKALDKIKRRPTQELQIRLQHYIGAQNIPVSFFEDEIPILDDTSNRLNNIFSVQQVFYSDTPMAFSDYDYRSDIEIAELTTTPHWDFLKQAILDTPTAILDEKQKQVTEEIAKIINGNVSLKEMDFERGFNYKRTTDGLTIELSESATGIKSFAILQLLLSEGLLNEKTLLIIDEPEAHLHPQWIVEYARILVLLNKKLGVKFMVASHNPDMVSALRYISEKEGILENMHFYLAEKVEGTEQFNYRNLENDIEPIFASFNIALDRINQYGV